MIIRPGKHEDLDQLLAMSARMHAESAYSFLPFDHEKVRQLILSYIEYPKQQCGLVAEENGLLLGMFAGYLTDYFFCHEKVATDMVLYVDRQHRGSSAAVRLIRAFRDWANERGAAEICLSISTEINTEITGRFYEKMGLAPVGKIYKQRLRTNNENSQPRRISGCFRYLPLV